MCTLAIYFQVSADLPLLVAANRDEYLARRTAEPQLIADNPWVVAGQDLEAGGTWFGVNEHRMVVGVLNRWQTDGSDEIRRSRGLLCLEVLQTQNAAEAIARLRHVRGREYHDFNLLVATATEAYVATNRGAVVNITPLTPGLHLLTNLDLNDPTCPRIAQSHRLFDALRLPAEAGDMPPVFAGLRAILSNHRVLLDPRGLHSDNTLCVHRPGYGTRSSAIVTHFACEQQPRFWHAPGPPCRVPYVELDLPG